MSFGTNKPGIFEQAQGLPSAGAPEVVRPDSEVAK